MQQQPQHADIHKRGLAGSLDAVASPARIALYDDFISNPRIVDVEPDSTKAFIGSLSSTIYNEAKAMGGGIPFSVIRQVTENFIHAYFSEMVVSVYDGGNTIRFSDQGPGIPDKINVQQPGFSSATQEMKKYIDGVGSGLPIVKEYLEMKNGYIEIEDNIGFGSVITISVKEKQIPLSNDGRQSSSIGSENINSISLNTVLSSLSPKGLKILSLFKSSHVWGLQDLCSETKIPNSTMFNELKKLTEMGILDRLNKKYTLSQFGENLLPYI